MARMRVCLCMLHGQVGQLSCRRWLNGACPILEARFNCCLSELTGALLVPSVTLGRSEDEAEEEPRRRRLNGERKKSLSLSRGRNGSLTIVRLREFSQS